MKKNNVPPHGVEYPADIIADLDLAPRSA